MEPFFSTLWKQRHFITTETPVQTVVSPEITKNVIGIMILYEKLS